MDQASYEPTDEDKRRDIIEQREQEPRTPRTPEELAADARLQLESGENMAALHTLDQLERLDPAWRSFGDSVRSAFADRERLASEAMRSEERLASEAMRSELREISVSRRVDTRSSVLIINSIDIRDRWVFDRHGTGQMYREAVRGSSHVVADVRIASDEHNPKLPQLAIYKVGASNERLVYVTTMIYRFYRWRDYGTYLGNNPDHGNDFAFTESIRFVAGASLRESVLESDVLFVLAEKNGCGVRQRDDFASPPISYAYELCYWPGSISPTEAGTVYQAVHVFNRGLL